MNRFVAAIDAARNQHDFVPVADQPAGEVPAPQTRSPGMAIFIGSLL
jgi:hypothetical protein